jgi:hypothetical protein
MTTSIILVCSDAFRIYWLQRSQLYFGSTDQNDNLGSNKDNLQLQLAMTVMEYT